MTAAACFGSDRKVCFEFDEASCAVREDKAWIGNQCRVFLGLELGFYIHFQNLRFGIHYLNLEFSIEI